MPGWIGLIRVDAHAYDAGEREPHLTLGALRNLLEHSSEVAAVVRGGLNEKSAYPFPPDVGS